MGHDVALSISVPVPHLDDAVDTSPNLADPHGGRHVSPAVMGERADYSTLVDGHEVRGSSGSKAARHNLVRSLQARPSGKAVPPAAPAVARIHKGATAARGTDNQIWAPVAGQVATGHHAVETAPSPGHRTGPSDAACAPRHHPEPVARASHEVGEAVAGEVAHAQCSIISAPIDGKGSLFGE